MRMQRLGVAVAAVVAATLAALPGPPAAAAWDIQGTGAGASKATTIKPPTVTTKCGLISTTVQVSWTPAAGSTFEPDRIQVQRSTDGGSTWTQAGNLVTGSAELVEKLFDDNGLSLATYHYRVVLWKGNWHTASAVAPPRTIALLLCL